MHSESLQERDSIGYRPWAHAVREQREILATLNPSDTQEDLHYGIGSWQYQINTLGLRQQLQILNGGKNDEILTRELHDCDGRMHRAVEERTKNMRAKHRSHILWSLNGDLWRDPFEPQGRRKRTW